MDQLFWILFGIVAIVMLYVIFRSFFTVRTAEVAVITRFGKFLRVAEPGLNWKSPFFDSVAGLTMSLRVNQITSHHGDEDEGQCFRHDSDFGAKSRAARKGLRRLLQAVRSGGADQIVCRAGDSGACAGHDAGRSFRKPVQYRGRSQTGTRRGYVGIRV